MQLDENTANSVITRPIAAAPGSVRWFRERDLGGGITGTTMDADYLNDLLGCIIDLLLAGSITRTKGASGDSDITDAIKAIIGLEKPQGALVGHLDRQSNSVIHMQPSNGADVVVGIDNKILKTTGNLVWDMATDLEGAEAASTKLYLYVRDNAGVLDEQISATVPDLPGGTKPGYKSGDATRRCVGSTYNDIGSNLIESIWLPGGEVLFKSHDGDHEHSLALTQNLWSAVIPVNIPLCATAFRVLCHIDTAFNRSIAYGASDAATDPTVLNSIIGTNASEILLEMSEDGNAGHHQSIEGIIPVANIASPGFKFTTYNQALTKNELVVKGYHCLFAPR